MNVSIRREQPGDEPDIYRVHSGSFPTEGEARLVNLLRAAKRLSLSLVAELDGEVVGHVAFSPVTTDTGATGTGLGPVAVPEPFQRHGIAAQLVRSGLDTCREAGFGWVVVLGSPAYYGRFGFRPASGFGLTGAYGGGDAYQALELTHGAIPAGVGQVRYAPEFAALGG